MGLESSRLRNVHRVFDPFVDRHDLVRLDRNEDPDGWDLHHFTTWLGTLTPHDLAAYSDSTSLSDKIAKWLKVSSNQVVVTAGSDAGIKLIFETYLDPGDKVVVLDPSWRMYDVWAAAYQAEISRVGFSERLVVGVNEIINRIASTRPRMVVIANPNQPTGTVIPSADMERIAEVCQEVGSILVVDEAYHLFYSSSSVEVLSKYPLLIVVRTFSKAFGLAGLRIGYCVGSEDRVRELRLLRPVADASSLAIQAASFSLKNLGWVMERVEDIVRGREFLLSVLRARGLAFFPSEANFVLVGCMSREGARDFVSESMTRGFIIKGPIDVGPVENLVRISIGSLSTMHRFWNECGALFELYARREK